MSEFIRILAHRFQNHKQQTDGFTFDYMAATEEEIMGLTNVFPETIQGLSSEVLKRVTPKQRPQLRRDIAYLIGLQGRQAEAWARYIADCEARAKNTNQWVQQNTR